MGIFYHVCTSKALLVLWRRIAISNEESGTVNDIYWRVALSENEPILIREGNREDYEDLVRLEEANSSVGIAFHKLR